jgi:hypothetical protein
MKSWITIETNYVRRRVSSSTKVVSNMRLEVAMGILPQVQVSKLLAASPAWWSLARVPSASSWRRSVCATLAIAMRTQGCSTIFASMHRRWRASQQVGQLQLRVGQLRLQEISEGPEATHHAVWSPSPSAMFGRHEAERHRYRVRVSTWCGG